MVFLRRKYTMAKCWRAGVRCRRLSAPFGGAWRLFASTQQTGGELRERQRGSGSTGQLELSCAFHPQATFISKSSIADETTDGSCQRFDHPAKLDQIVASTQTPRPVSRRSSRPRQHGFHFGPVCFRVGGVRGRVIFTGFHRIKNGQACQTQRRGNGNRLGARGVRFPQPHFHTHVKRAGPWKPSWVMPAKQPSSQACSIDSIPYPCQSAMVSRCRRRDYMMWCPFAGGVYWRCFQGGRAASYPPAAAGEAWTLGVPTSSPKLFLWLCRLVG